MKKKQDPFTGLFSRIEDQNVPTKAQEEKLLRAVLTQSRGTDAIPLKKAAAWITEYPWRFAFGAAALQAGICTLIFGQGYTRLLMSLFGG